ncbi:EAL domain-containing protein [Aliikangiella coralliicola]|uniref:EAL domain-containing protein n=1 Tax=Aliikangiella coralliicola TaxID=2592383 RepID=A0A545UEK8_9GAMM|nr:EAL domain-containing protein [Aliikangiella coralliicola]TQV87823.1 EAL domain-containing protein [Aliikangiella coralliicola]
MNKILLFFLANLIIIPCLKSESTTSLIKQTGFRQYATDQGLSHNTVTHFLQDRKGFMWISTTAGLNRLDGNKIEAIQGPDQILFGNSINHLIQDSKGKIWASTYGGLIRLAHNQGDGQVYQLPSFASEPDQKNYTIAIIEAEPEKFWIVSWEGIYQLNTRDKEIHAFPSMKELLNKGIYIKTAFEDKNIIWLGTTNGLYQFNKRDSSLRQYPLTKSLNQSAIDQLLKIDNEKMLLVSGQNLFRINLKESEQAAELLMTEQLITSMVKFGQSVFLSFKDRLYRYETYSGTISHLFSLSEILPKYTNYTITKLFLDKNHKLWLGTNSQGAYVWDPQSLHFQSIYTLTQNPEIKLNDNSVWSFVEESPGNFWIGTEMGLNYLSSSEGTLESHLALDKYNLSSQQARIFFIQKDGDTLWLATANGLIKYQPKEKKLEVYRPKKLSPDTDFFIYSIALTDLGDIWLATQQGALKFSPKTKKFDYENQLMTPDNIEISSFVRYQDNLLWFGFKSSLISYDYRQKIRKEVFKARHKSRNVDLFLTDFYLDKEKKQLWTAFSGEGIYVTDLTATENNVIRHFSPRNGFVDNVVYSLLPDKDYLWATTHSGLAKINLQTFNYLMFDFYNGLPGNEFNEGASSKTSSGDLMFGSTNGILIIEPDKLSLPDERISPLITAVQLRDKVILSSDIDWSERNVILPKHENLITFHLSVLDYLTPQKWQYEYWLTGVEQTKPQLVSASELTIGDLSAGNYQLNVRAVLPNYQYFSKIESIPFSVEAPLWMSVKFQTAAYLLLAILIFWYLYRRGNVKRTLVNLCKELQEKEKRLELALLDKRRGVWDWQRNSSKSKNSTITITMTEDDEIVMTMSKYESYIHHQDVDNVKQAWEKFINGNDNAIKMVYRVFFFEEWVWTKLYGRVYQRDEEGRPIRATGTWLDISEEKKAETKLNLYKQAVYSTRDVIIIANSKLDIAVVNNAYHVQTGFESSSLIGKNIIRVAKRILSKDVTENLRAQVRQKKSWQGEATMPRKNGTSYPISIRVDVIEGESKDFNYVIVITDISSLTSSTSSQLGDAYYDNLTGLPNKILTNDRLTHAIDHANNNKAKLVFVTIAIDRFEFLCQTLGRTSIRELLLNTSNCIIKHLNEDDTLARYETNKFVIILEGINKFEDTAFKIENILTEIAKQKLSTSASITANAGVSCFPVDATTNEKLIESSMRALKSARQQGAQIVSYINQDLQKKTSERIAMKYALLEALENNQFFLVYQPKVDLTRNQTVGFEILLRWRTNEGTTVYPSQFINIAEQTGLIEPLTEWLINQSFRILRQWKAEGFSVAFAINLIPRYCAKIACPEHLLKKLQTFNLEATDIHIEINEKHLRLQDEHDLQFLTELDKNGFKVTLDDFASGKTPLANLNKLPIHAIKMHRDLTRGIGKNPDDEALIKTIADLANNLNFVATAKSIETEQQLEFLQKSGYRYGQGYYFSDPLTESHARQFLIKMQSKL